MKKTLFPLAVLILTAIISLLFSCRNDIKGFEDIEDEEIEAANKGLDTTGVKSAGFVAKGATWEAWNRYFKDCIKNVNLQKGQFAGYSNAIKVGDLRTKSGLASYSLAGSLPAGEYEKWIKTGNSADGCQGQTLIDKSLQNTIAASMLDVGNAEIQIARNLIDSTVIQFGSFVVEEIENIDRFKDFINSDPSMSGYKKALFNKNRRLIVQAVKVSNIKMDINLRTEFSAGLNATLAEGLTDKIKVADGEIDVKFQKTSEKSFSCEVNTSFYVFVHLKRIKP